MAPRWRAWLGLLLLHLATVEPGEAPLCNRTVLAASDAKAATTIETLMIVSHPDDEVMWGAEWLGASTHLVVVSRGTPSLRCEKRGGSKAHSCNEAEAHRRRTAMANAAGLVGASWEQWGW